MEVSYIEREIRSKMYKLFFIESTFLKLDN